MDKVKVNIENLIATGEILISKGLYKEAIGVYWNATRSIVFYELQKKEVVCRSTEEAIKEFVKLYFNSEMSENLIFLEKIALLCEWDIHFDIKYSQVKEYQIICMNFIGEFILLPNSENGIYYSVLKEEMNRHLEDLYYTKSQHFSASTRCDNLYKLFLVLGFVVSIFGLSALFYILTVGTERGLALTQTVTLFGVFVTIWPLVRDYSGKAVVHRRFADEYGRLYKMGRNWRTEFPDESRLQEAESSVLLIRSLIMTMNSLTPAVKKIDYKNAKESFERDKDEILMK